MGRECRRVPANWQHPTDETGSYKPLYDQSYKEALAEWQFEHQKWAEGLTKNWVTGEWEPHNETCSFEDWNGEEPDPEYYRPDWSESEATHYQMYETCSEGTPISPVFATPEEVARYCADNGVSSFADLTASYEAWLAIAKGRSSISAVITLEGLIDGVSYMEEGECRNGDLES